MSHSCDIDGAHRCHQLAALRHERGNTAHRGIGQRKQVLPYSLDVERILPNDERANSLQDFVDGAQALGALEEKRTMRLADPNQASVGRKLDDDLADLANRLSGRANRFAATARIENTSRAL